MQKVLVYFDLHRKTWSAKVPSTPADQSIGVLNGLSRVCGLAGIDPKIISHVMHGTTVATNTVLTSSGARVGLVTTKGYRQVLQIARSFVPGGLAIVNAEFFAKTIAFVAIAAFGWRLRRNATAKVIVPVAPAGSRSAAT